MNQALEASLLHQALALLRSGALVGLPTETVYGLAADASSPDAVKKIFLAKGRPPTHPLIVHLPSVALLDQWATDIPRAAYQLAEHCWPGPLTLILHKHPQVNTIVTGGKQTIGLRVPKHPIAQQVLQAFHGGLAAPSANRFCHLSSTSASDVKEELGDRVALVLDGGESAVGIESTILDLTQSQPTIVRPGFYTATDLSEILQQPVLYAQTDQTQTPGNLAHHYAPDTPVYLIAHLPEKPLPEKSGLIGFEATRAAASVIQLPRDPSQYAHALYQRLRTLDHEGLDQIFIVHPPQTEAWRAVNDRLQRLASAK